MRLLKFTRYQEWWEYKLIPFLLVGYATVLYYNLEIENVGLHILKILLAVVFGAVYVSVINDYTDIYEDKLAGKRNSMAKLPEFSRLLIISLCIAIGLISCFFMFSDTLSLAFFILSYIVFTAYSVPPLRLKKRGFLGVLCDASGAHLFPAVLLACHLPFIVSISRNVLWTLSIGCWSLLYGIRGILVHQFNDRDNDIKSGTTTFAASLRPTDFKGTEKLILTFEFFGIAFIIYSLFNIWIALAIVFYLLLALGRHYILRYRSCIVILPKDKPSQLLLNDFYLVFLPVAILLTFTIHNEYGWIALLIHLLLFPRHILLVLKDFKIIIKQLIYNQSEIKN